MYLSHLKFFWRVADVKSISRVINLSFHPVTLCTHLSCWPLKFIFFKIRLLFLLPSFSSISWPYRAWFPYPLLVIPVSALFVFLSSEMPCPFSSGGSPPPLLVFSPCLLQLGQLPWPSPDHLALLLTPLCLDSVS